MKKWILFFCLCFFTFTLSGCLPYIGFYKDLVKDITEPVQDIIDETSVILYETLLDATGFHEDGTYSDSALLKVASFAEDRTITFTDSPTLTEYAKTISSVTEKGIMNQINHNSTSLPHTAEELYSYTLWSHYDPEKEEDAQAFTCYCILYGDDSGYYLKAEYTDERFEDSPYYLILNDWMEDFFLDLARE